MVSKLFGTILVLCASVNLYCSAQEWQNFIEACVFRDTFMTHDIGLNAHITNTKLSVYEFRHPSLGLFTCLVLRNADFEYQSLELELSDEARKRKVESNACRKYPLSTDLKESFTIASKHEVRVVTYRPVGSPFPMQSIRSIKLDGVEQVQMPLHTELMDAESVIEACTRHASIRRYAHISDCTYESLFRIFKIKLDNKLVWCYIQMQSSAGQIDFDISNNNYKLYETYPQLDVIKNIKNNHVIINTRNIGIHELPRILAVHQANASEPPPTINFVRVNSKQICQTPLVEKTINCGRPQIRYEPFTSEVSPGQYPWLVFVYAGVNDTEPKCEGTLIDHETVITGASCVMDSAGQKLSATKLRILANMTEKPNSMDHYDFLAIRDVIVSEFYNKQYYEYDVALLKLEKSFTSFLNVSMPICTTNNAELYKEQTGIVTGYGLDRLSAPLTKLSQAHLQRLRPDVCRKRDSFFRMYLNENTYCVDYANDTKICPEMHGSGMFVKAGDIWILSGIVTIGVGTGDRCSLSAISLYTDIASLHGFIEDNRS